MNDIWPKVRSYCRKAGLPAPYKSLLITPECGKEWHWLIGRHPELTKLASELRFNSDVCTTLLNKKVRFGFRVSGEHGYPKDLPPLTLARQERYGTAKKRDTIDHSKERTDEICKPANRIKHQVYGTKTMDSPKSRKGDEYANVATYWASQTPQAHHIVEYNNLKALGLSKPGSADELDYDSLPCVLLMAEFHQRYISSVLKPTHLVETEKLKATPDKSEALNEIYKALYAQCPQEAGVPFPLWSLWKISEVILAAASERLKEDIIAFESSSDVDGPRF